MANVFLNDNLLSLNSYQFRNFSELLPLLKQNYIVSDEILTLVKLNNKFITPDNKRELLNVVLGPEDVLLLQTESKQAHIFDLVLEAQGLLEKMIKAIDGICECYALKDFELGDKKILPLLNSLEVFIESYLLINQKIAINPNTKAAGGGNIKETQIHLLSILKAIKPAKDKKDVVMLNDLLQYELKDNLTLWKIQIMPMIKDLIIF